MAQENLKNEDLSIKVIKFFIYTYINISQL